LAPGISPEKESCGEGKTGSTREEGRTDEEEEEEEEKSVET